MNPAFKRKTWNDGTSGRKYYDKRIVLVPVNSWFLDNPNNPIPIDESGNIDYIDFIM